VKQAISNLEIFRVVCRIPSLQDEWYPSTTFADAINKYYQLSGDAVITIKDLNDTITCDSILQSEFSASKKQGNKSGIYQARTKIALLKSIVYKYEVDAAKKKVACEIKETQVDMSKQQLESMLLSEGLPYKGTTTRLQNR